MDKNEGTVVAITGGIGSGKSSAVRYIEQLGHKVIYTDDFTKELMSSLEELKQELIEAFGKDTYFPDGSLNKEFLADAVFCGSNKCKENLKKLNLIVHPYVLVERERLIEDYIEKGATHVFVESALVYEAGNEEFFDYVVVIHAPEDLVIKRAKENGMSEKAIRNRLANQMSPTEKKNLADFVIENKGSIEDLKKAVDFIVSIV